MVGAAKRDWSYPCKIHSGSPRAGCQVLPKISILQGPIRAAQSPKARLRQETNCSATCWWSTPAMSRVRSVQTRTWGAVARGSPGSAATRALRSGQLWRWPQTLGGVASPLAHGRALRSATRLVKQESRIRQRRRMLERRRQPQVMVEPCLERDKPTK